MILDRSLGQWEGGTEHKLFSIRLSTTTQPFFESDGYLINFKNKKVLAKTVANGKAAALTQWAGYSDPNFFRVSWLLGPELFRVLVQSSQPTACGSSAAFPLVTGWPMERRV